MPDTPATTVADVIGKSGPSLSATSDMPAAPTPETPVESAVTAPAEGEARTTEAATETETTADAKPKKDGISERFSKMASDRRAAEERADRLAKSLEDALGAISKLTPANQTKPQTETAEPRPKRDSFDSPDAYDAALIEWSTGQAMKLAKAEAEKERLDGERKATEEKQRTERATLEKEWGDKVTKAKEKYTDFDEVTQREDVAISMPMSHAILNVENGPDIAYYLGKNPDVAARISAIQNPVVQVFEIGRLAASLAEKPNVSRTPPPIKPIGSKAAAGPKSRDEMSMDEYAATHPRYGRSAAGSGARH